MERKYRLEISRLEREKEEATEGVTREIQSLRNSFQSELQSIEEKYNGERRDWKLKLKEKDDAIQAVTDEIHALKNKLRSMEEKEKHEHASRDAVVKEKEAKCEELQKQLTAIQQEQEKASSVSPKELEEQLATAQKTWDEEKKKIVQQADDQKIALDKLEKRYDDLMTQYEEVEYELITKNKEVSAMRQELMHMKEAAAASSAPIQPEKTVVITPKADVTQAAPAKPAVVPAPEPATTAPASKPRKSCLQKFWQSMNEPVIEIDLRKDQNTKNK
jgi:chromosome segregation ATPase